MIGIIFFDPDFISTSMFSSGTVDKIVGQIISDVEENDIANLNAEKD